MFNRYRTKGIFLKSENMGESDKIFVIYTSDFGKIKIFAKSIRKNGSKLRFGTNFFFLNEIEFIEGKNYRTLTDIKIMDDFKMIRKDLLSSALACKALEDIDLLTKEGEKDNEIWRLLSVFLSEMTRQGKEFGLSGYFHFIWKLFSFLGYKPELDKCVFCFKDLRNPPFYFSSVQGGIAGACCMERLEDPEEVDWEIISLLKSFTKKDIRFPKLKMNVNTVKKIQNITNNYSRQI